MATCVRCGGDFEEGDNSPSACTFHGAVTGQTAVYALYEDHHHDDPSLDGGPGPRFARRWGCCQDPDATAGGCKVGWHVRHADVGGERWGAVRLARRG